MTYNQMHCLQGDYFECSSTTVVESEPEKIQNDIASQNLPLETSSYQSVEHSVSESSEEEGFPSYSIDTAHYRETSVRNAPADSFSSGSFDPDRRRFHSPRVS